MLFRLFSFLIFFNIVACVTTTTPKNANEGFEFAKKDFDDNNFEIAIVSLSQFIADYPTDPLATDAALLIADARFKLGKYEEAIIDYQEFIQLHPDHERIDYAKYQIGESYWQESSNKVDLDQEFTKQALAEWQRFIEQHPESQFVALANQKIKDGSERIIGHRNFAAKFYCRRGQHSACALRNLQLIEDYPSNPSLLKDAKERAADALLKLANMKEKDPESDANIFLKDHSADELRKIAKELQSSIN